MRWISREGRVGDRRIVRRFAILPIVVRYETRWLEWCRIEQHYLYKTFLMFEYMGWVNSHFVDWEAGE